MSTFRPDNPPFLPGVVREIRETLFKATQEEFGQLVGSTRRSVIRWELGTHQPTPKTRLLIRTLAKQREDAGYVRKSPEDATVTPRSKLWKPRKGSGGYHKGLRAKHKIIGWGNACKYLGFKTRHYHKVRDLIDQGRLKPAYDGDGKPVFPLAQMEKVLAQLRRTRRLLGVPLMYISKSEARRLRKHREQQKKARTDYYRRWSRARSERRRQAELADNPLISSTEIKRLRIKTLGMSFEQFADLLGIHHTTVRRWEKGSYKPIKAHRRRLHDLIASLPKQPDGNPTNK